MTSGSEHPNFRTYQPVLHLMQGLIVSNNLHSGGDTQRRRVYEIDAV